MQKNRLGLSDLYVSEIGLGCMSLGTDEHKAVSIISEALELGINYLDTADLYDFGLNEEFVGKAVKGRRDDIIIATKGGNHWENDRDGWYWDPSKAYIKEAVKNSLLRLQTDYIDLYQLHGGTIDDPIDETIEAFEELKREGIIREYGISSIRPNVIREYARRSNIVSVMTQYSILDRRPEEEVLGLLEEKEISAIARGPLAKGLLTGRFAEKAEKFKDGGHLGYTYEDLYAIGRRLGETADSRFMEESLALRYPLHHPAVAAVIPGASSSLQLQENVQAVSRGSIDDETFRKLQSLTRAITYDKHQ
ncbi:aldo/keto reductase [Bacillus marinisedimentorum]|uniref:aldo/keto reductase n=1 Tax=Bacillus marinisedimentorum TaxID=1821260 RepID=UPI000871E778|nr:aldo/keto reductase [Bacillus marinisedimentorum]